MAVKIVVPVKLLAQALSRGRAGKRKSISSARSKKRSRALLRNPTSQQVDRENQETLAQMDIEDESE